MKKILLAISLFLQFTNLAAQKVEGFDYFFKPTVHAPRYYVVTEKKDSLWQRQAWYLPERGMAMEGWYLDEEAKTAHGKFTYYHANKTLKSVGKILNGKREGIWLEYHDNGMMKDSANYVAGRLKGIRLKWHADGMPSDSMNFDGAGNGVQVSWYTNGTPSSAGRWVSDTLKKGRWQYFHFNSKLKATEDYVDGKRTAIVCYDENGNMLDSANCSEREADFPGGINLWSRYVRQNLNGNIPAKAGAPAGQYTVILLFVIDTDGKVVDIKPETKFGYGMEEEAVRILNNSPKWKPAQQFGRSVKAYRRQPITFVVSD